MKYFNYVNFLADLITIDTPEVRFHSNGKWFNLRGKEVESFPLPPLSSSHLDYENEIIYVNLDVCEDQFEYIILAVQMRLLFEYKTVFVDNTLKDATSMDTSVWEDNFNNFIYDTEDPNFLNQPVLLDAYAFGWLIGLYMFDRPISVQCDESLFDDAKKAMLDEYSLKEIEESAYMFGIQRMITRYNIN